MGNGEPECHQHKLQPMDTAPHTVSEEHYLQSSFPSPYGDTSGDFLLAQGYIYQGEQARISKVEGLAHISLPIWISFSTRGGSVLLLSGLCGSSSWTLDNFVI